MASIHILKRISFFVLLLSVLSSACTRISTSELGLGLLPSLDAINTKDTILEVETETVDMPDSLKIYGTDLHVLGELNNDPLFGKTKATMFFQMLPSYFPFYFLGSRDSITIDSAVLVLKYAGFYGDSTQPVTINVHQIDPSTPLDIAKYYPSNYPEAFGIKAGAALGNPVTVDLSKVGDSVVNRYEAAKNQVRIKLFDKTAYMFIKGFDSTTAYKNDTALRTYFPGFALSVASNASNNVLMKFNMTDTNTKLALYYKTNYSPTGAVGKIDTTVQYMRFSLSANGDANFIKRDRTGSELAKHMNGNTNDSLVYVQTSPGTAVKVKIPTIKQFANKIVHRAELIAEQVPDDARLNTIEAQMLAPKRLFIASYDAVKKEVRSVPNDYQGIANSEMMIRLGGYQTSKTTNGYNNVATYNFNITRYVQGVIAKNDSSFDFRIFAPVNDSLIYVPPYPYNTSASTDYITTSFGNQAAIGRVRLGGGKHSKFKMRLRVYYSDL